MDLLSRNNAKIAFASIAFMLAASAFSATGCGDSRVSADAVGFSAISAGQRTADIKVKFDFQEYKTVESGVKSFEFTLYDENLNVCFTKTVQRGDFKQGCVNLHGVPVSAESLVCLFRDKYQNPIGLTESIALDLTPGAEVTLNNPDFASTAAELGERLSLLRFSSAAPVKLRTGEKVQLKAEGAFSCRNGAELLCDLTSCSRLVWESSNNSVLRHLGGGSFKALSCGGVKVYASLGQKQIAADIIVRAASAPEKASPSEPAGGDAAADNAGNSIDPITAADPEPVPVETPCALKLDLSRCCLPSDLSLEVRGYDADNQLRFRKNCAGLKESLEADQSVAKVAGILLESDGQVYGIFAADVNMSGQKSCTLDSPRIISGAELAAYGEMVISGDKAVYDLADEELIYEKTESDSRSVYVHCSAEVRYSIIPGVWAYSSAGDFLERLCSFKAEDSDSEEYGVFRFFEAGEYTVSVSYRGITGVFSVEVIDSSSPVSGDYRLNIDLSSSGLPSGAVYEARGYSSRGTLLFSEQGVSDLNSTFADINKNTVKVIGVIKSSDGEPWGMFEQNISLKDGQICRISQPDLLTGEQFAQEKAELSFSISPAEYDLRYKNADGYVAVSTQPALTYSYGSGWSETFSRSDIGCWEDFALSSSPYLEYYSFEEKYRLKVYEAGQYVISASYRGLTSSSAQIFVADIPPAYSVEINFAADGLPADSSLIYCQLFKEGTAVSEEFSRNSSSSLSFDEVSSEADGIVIKVKNTSGQLAGLHYQVLNFGEDNKAVLNGVSVASGSAMDAYIKSFAASPGHSLKRSGEYVVGSAQAELTFNSGKIIQTRDVSTEAVWSSSDMTKGAANNSWRIGRAGESTFRAALGSRYADLKAYASGVCSDSLYQYGQADLSNNLAVTLAIYAPDGTSSKGSFSGGIAGGTPSAVNQSAAEADGRLTKALDGGEQGESEIRRQEAEAFEKFKKNSGGSRLNFSMDDAYPKTLDYVNAKSGDTVSGVYDSVRKASYDAKVILGGDGLTLGNGYRTSGKVIILAEIKDGTPLLDLTNSVDLLQVLMIDYMLGVKNPFDSEGKPVLERIRSDVGHECGYGCGGGVSELEKVVISIADIGESGTIAYTIATNCFPRKLINTSNECEMITFNYSKYQQFDPASMCSNFAHEFAHMVSFNTRAFRDMPDGYIAAANRYVDRMSILEEGHADLCSFLCGFGCDDRTGDFSEFQNLVGLTSLPSWAVSYASKALDRRVKSYSYLNALGSYSIKDAGYYAASGSSTIANYGQGCFFLTYLYDRYGLNAVNKFYNSSPNDSAYADLAYGAAHKDFDLLAAVVGEETGKAVSFADIYADYGKALLLNSGGADSIPSAYRLSTLVPGKTYDSSLTAAAYRYYGALPPITPVGMGTNLSVSDIIPWSLNYYITPNMTYSVGASSSVFGMWGGLNSFFKMMLFNNSLIYGQDID